MNLKNKTNEELRDMLKRLNSQLRCAKELIDNEKYEIHQEIIRREKDNEQ